MMNARPRRWRPFVPPLRHPSAAPLPVPAGPWGAPWGAAWGPGPQARSSHVSVVSPTVRVMASTYDVVAKPVLIRPETDDRTIRVMRLRAKGHRDAAGTSRTHRSVGLLYARVLPRGSIVCRTPGVTVALLTRSTTSGRELGGATQPIHPELERCRFRTEQPASPVTYVLHEPPLMSLKGAAMTRPIPTTSVLAASVVSLTLSSPRPAAGLTAIRRRGRPYCPAPGPSRHPGSRHGDVGRGHQWRSGEHENRKHQSCTRGP